MKKALLLSVTALLLCSNAEARKWDFSKWSPTTVANIEADANWSSDEKGNGTVFAGAYWQKAGSLADGCDADGNLLANGAIIAELEGLKVTTLASGHYAIATDYQVTKDANAWGPYHGTQYFWFAGGNKCRMVIPAVKPGTTIKAGLESHKPSDGRGIDLYVNNEKVTMDPAAYPTTYNDYTWVIPDTIQAETVDVEIRPSSGCHIYYLDVEETETLAEELKVAYIFDGSYNGAKDADKNPIGYAVNGGLESDPIYTNLLDIFAVEAIDVNSAEIKAMTTAQFNDSMITYDVVVLSEAVGSGNTYAKGMVDIINKVPMLNFKAFMYKNGVWNMGAGVNPSPVATSVTVAEAYLEDALFADVELEEGGVLPLFISNEVVAGNLVQSYTTTEGSLFANDAVYATAGANNAVHMHGTRNKYMLIPMSSDNLSLNGDWNVTEAATTMISNAVKILGESKASVIPASTPMIKQEYANQLTTVTITCSTNGSVVYYTLDGTDPTETSTKYTEPLQVTEQGVVVKAFATAQGYDPSAIATATIDVKTQLAMPELTITGGQDSVSIVLTHSDTTAVIYYAFFNTNKAAEATVFEEKSTVVVKESGTLYAFATSAKSMQSELLVQSFAVAGIPAPKDTVAHFLPSKTAWGDSCQIYWAGELVGGWNAAVEAGVASLKSSAYYHFGQSGKNCYTDEIESTEPVKDEEGNVLKDMNGQDSVKITFKIDPAVNGKVVSPMNPGWEVLSNGQVMTIENAAPAYFVGNGAANRCADRAIDMITGGPKCKGLMDFGAKAAGCPYSLRVQTTEKHAAPFYVETYLGNGSTNNNCAIQVQVSADGEEWTAIQDLTLSTAQRYWRRHRVHFAETGEYYVRIAQVGNTSKAQLYDVLVITTDGVTGIENVNANVNSNNNRIFDLQGREVSSMVRGQLYIQNGKKVVIK